MSGDHLISFIDILGFQDLLNRSDWENQVDDIVSTINQIVEIHRGDHSFHTIQVSDAIVIWSNEIKKENTYYNFMQIRPILNIIKKLQITLACKNIWIRGGVTYGKIKIINGNATPNIFGPAFVKAYTLEKGAKYPRVIVDDCIINATNSDPSFFISSTNDHPANPFKKLLHSWNISIGKKGIFKKDCYTFVDYLSSETDQWQVICEHLIKNFENIPKDKKGVREKYRWVGEYIHENSNRLPADRKATLASCLELIQSFPSE